jgi:hypothetical protein
LIEKAHTFSEKLISDINNYEKETIQSFKNKKLQRNIEIGEVKVEVNKFHVETSQYLEEFKIDDRIVEESLQNVTKMIQELNEVDDPFRNTKMEFVRSDDTFVMPNLGLLVNKPTNSLPDINVSHDTISDIDVSHDTIYNFNVPREVLQHNPSYGRRVLNRIFIIIREICNMPEEVEVLLAMLGIVLGIIGCFLIFLALLECCLIYVNVKDETL